MTVQRVLLTLNVHFNSFPFWHNMAMIFYYTIFDMMKSERMFCEQDFAQHGRSKLVKLRSERRLYAQFVYEVGLPALN